MAASSHHPVALNRAKARVALLRVLPELGKSTQALTERLIATLAEDGRGNVKALHEGLFPMADTKAASAQLSKLLSAIEAAAAAQGLHFSAAYKGAKNAGVAQRWLFFKGPRSDLVADTEGLNAIPAEGLIPGQTGTLLVGERTLVLMTFNDHEFQAVRKAFWLGAEAPRVQRAGAAANADDLGLHSNARVLHHHCAQGNAASQSAATELRLAYAPVAIVAVGIAFGIDEQRQSLGMCWCRSTLSLAIWPRCIRGAGSRCVARGRRPAGVGWTPCGSSTHAS